GEVDEGAVDPLQAALDAVPEPAFTLMLGHAGAFGAPARTSATWLALEGDVAALRALAARVEDAVRLVGLPSETRPYSPHLTLARLRRDASGADRRAIADAVRRIEPPHTIPLEVDAFALVRSYLGGPRPRYEVLSRHP